MPPRAGQKTGCWCQGPSLAPRARARRPLPTLRTRGRGGEGTRTTGSCEAIGRRSCGLLGRGRRLRRRGSRCIRLGRRGFLLSGLRRLGGRGRRGAGANPQFRVHLLVLLELLLELEGVLRVCESDGQHVLAHLALREVLREPHPRPITTRVLHQLHRGENSVVGTDFERLLAAHEEANLLVLLVLQELDVARAALFPLLVRLVEAEELSAHFEEHVLLLLVCLHLDFLKLHKRRPLTASLLLGCELVVIVLGTVVGLRRSLLRFLLSHCVGLQPREQGPGGLGGEPVGPGARGARGGGRGGPGTR
mmetsp:Transcript_14100/g.41475  ORF Transcript_14100/g.41475 Transcript_14100/m.41475 type:complete len:306 (+) Transcript_14100:322-1239(+)